MLSSHESIGESSPGNGGIPSVKHNDPLVALHQLYPDLTPDELVTAKENLDRYLSLVWEIFEERLQQERSTDNILVDSSVPRGTIEERSIPT